MKLASRKNMMSIKGMISIRARLCGIGEATCIELVGRARHCIGDWDFYFRCNFPGLKTPASKSAGGRVVENRTADGLRHRCIGYTAAGRVHAEHGNTAAGDVAAARFIRVIRFWSKNRHRFSARDRHRSWNACLRRFYRTGGLWPNFLWWGLFFVENPRHFWERRRLWECEYLPGGRRVGLPGCA